MRLYTELQSWPVTEDNVINMIEILTIPFGENGEKNLRGYTALLGLKNIAEINFECVRIFLFQFLCAADLDKKYADGVEALLNLSIAAFELLERAGVPKIVSAYAQILRNEFAELIDDVADLSLGLLGTKLSYETTFCCK